MIEKQQIDLIAIVILSIKETEDENFGYNRVKGKKVLSRNEKNATLIYIISQQKLFCSRNI